VSDQVLASYALVMLDGAKKSKPGARAAPTCCNDGAPRDAIERLAVESASHHP
jgi:hypothetical protein